MKRIFFILILCLGLLQPNQLQLFSTEVIDSSGIVLQNILEELLQIGVIRTGSFELKSGVISPHYVDLRRALSYPHVLIQISDHMYKKIEKLSFDILCGVPYAALAMCTGISLRHNIPMIMMRKESKDYGTRQMIEGVHHINNRVLIVEDVITSGKSILKVAQILRAHGLIVQDAVVFLDREEGGKEYLASFGIQVHPVLTISQLLEISNKKVVSYP